MTIREYLQRAQEEGFAIGQFNISTHEQLRAIVQASLALSAPVIVGTSGGESRFIGIEQAVSMVNGWRRAVEREGKELPIFLNLDHAEDIAHIRHAIDAGYDAVHYDGSRLPVHENIENTKQVVEYAGDDVLVEGEIGEIGTESSQVYHTDLSIAQEDLTDPQQVRDFIEETDVATLAISIGTFHGVEASGENPHIDLDRLRAIRAQTSSFLVLHGSSGTPQEDVEESVAIGIDKINVNTDLRMAFTEALRQSLKDNPEEATPYKYLPPAIEAMQTVVEEKIRLFGSAGKW